MSRICRQLLLLALVIGVPRGAAAQFTTFIPPKSTVPVYPVNAVLATPERKPNPDSILSMQLKRMETWVDSAARVPAALRTSAQAPAKHSAAPEVKAVATTAASAPIDTTGLSIPWPRFRNGARAPATASDLPLFALLGATTFGAGLLLVMRAPSRRPELIRKRVGSRAADRA